MCLEYTDGVKRRGGGNDDDRQRQNEEGDAMLWDWELCLRFFLYFHSLSPTERKDGEDNTAVLG